MLTVVWILIWFFSVLNFFFCFCLVWFFFYLVWRIVYWYQVVLPQWIFLKKLFRSYSGEHIYSDWMANLLIYLLLISLCIILKSVIFNLIISCSRNWARLRQEISMAELGPGGQAKKKKQTHSLLKIGCVAWEE